MKWLVQDGAEVAEGDPIYTLETNKAAQEIEAPAFGRVVHKVEAGGTYDVGYEVGEII